MSRRWLWIGLTLLIVAGGAALLWWVQTRGVPRPVRLLPETESVFYVNVELLRRAGVFDGFSPVPREAEYQEFIRATGFQFERDLDQAAFAVHLPGTGGRDAGAATRFSEVFVGRINEAAAAAYFGKVASSVGEHQGVTLYQLPVEDRTVRVAILDGNRVAVSNAADDGPIRRIIEHVRAAQLPAGPEIVRRYYHAIPTGSVAWMITRAVPDAKGGEAFLLPGGFSLPLPQGSVLVASVRWVGSVEFRAQAFTGSEEQARRVASSLNAYLAIFRALEAGAEKRAADPDVRRFLDSIRIEHQGERAVVTATLPPGFLRKMAADPPAQAEAQIQER